MSLLISKIATELEVRFDQIEAAVKLLDAGDSIPFISRYRKEATGGLSDMALRSLEKRLHYLRELEERRGVILESIEKQGKLTPELSEAIQNADSKARLEDLYLPYKPKLRTKAQIAREAGLAPLAEALLTNPSLDPEETAKRYINPENKVDDEKAALEGARFILMEQFTEQADLVGCLRDKLWEKGILTSKMLAEKEESGNKYKDYFEYSELIKNMPSHRTLAVLRGRQEGMLQVSLQREDLVFEQIIGDYFKIQNRGRKADSWLLETVKWAWRVKLFTQLELALIARLRESSEEAAIQVFAHNLRDLLMSAPAGSRATLGLDPGFRTGVKVAVVDTTGKVVQHCAIYPHEPKNEWDKSLKILTELCRLYHVELISIGNGTASRETDQLALDLIQKHPELKLKKIVVSEAGASVYSASELAAEEFPDLDVTIRGAVSIARRLQDPLAELVKIEPKAIGVGQYQHDVNQVKLANSLATVVEDCVNAVGVDVNTASVALLAQVAGLNTSIAKNIVTFRNENGKFSNRKQLIKISRLGAKTFEQSAGFLRIVSGENPLDASAVHPEAYPIVEAILTKTHKTLPEIIGNKFFLQNLKPEDFIDEKFGVPTVTDILQELQKPGRDPRPEFKTASFSQTVLTLNDVKIGMILEGVVTNVADFGAFVDIGVHQDGLVHISALSNRFIKNPRDIVKTGDIVKVKVMEVDVSRKRIGLTLRLEDEPKKEGTHKETKKPENLTPIKSSEGKDFRRNLNNNSSNKKPLAAGSLFGDVLQKTLKKE